MSVTISRGLLVVVGHWNWKWELPLSSVYGIHFILNCTLNLRFFCAHVLYRDLLKTIITATVSDRFILISDLQYAIKFSPSRYFFVPQHIHDDELNDFKLFKCSITNNNNNASDVTFFYGFVTIFRRFILHLINISIGNIFRHCWTM